MLQRFAAVAVVMMLGGLAGCQSGVPLFNGRDLTGWHEIGSENAWSIRDGVLVCNGQKTGYAWLATDKKYDDFVLGFDWRIPAEGNTGVFLRVPSHEGRASMLGFEVQIRDDRADADLSDATGAVFRRVHALGRFANPPGEWNRTEITLRGRTFTVRLNGHLVSQADLNQVPALESDPPMSAVPDTGYIGLQNHGQPAEFRNIRLQPLR